MNLDKDIIRQKILNQRRDFDLLQYDSRNELILKKVVQLITGLTERGSTVGLYWPLNGEPDIFKAILEIEVAVALPKISTSGITFVKYTPGQKIERYGTTDLYQPTSSFEVKPNIIFLPGLAFSIDGYRLGFGKGHYDKYLTAMKPHEKPIAIGVCFQENLLERLPISSYDYRLSYVVTDQALIRV